MQLPKDIPSLRDLLEASGLRSTSQPVNGVDLATGTSLFAAGLLVGAGLGLLFAPSTGTTLRRRIGERVGAGVTDLRERVETARTPRTDSRDAKTNAL